MRKEKENCHRSSSKLDNIPSMTNSDTCTNKETNSPSMKTNEENILLKVRTHMKPRLSIYYVVIFQSKHTMYIYSPHNHFLSMPMHQA